MADPQPWWLVAGGAAGGWLAKIVSDWWGFRSNAASTEVQREATALQGFKDLSAEHRADLAELRHEFEALRVQHDTCKQELENARSDLADLRADLTVLQGLVVTQINQEVEKEDT